MTTLVSSTSESAQRRRLSLSEGTVKRKRRWMNQDNEILRNGIGNGMKPKLPPLWKRFTKQEFADIVEKHLGIITVCCNVLDCTYS